MLPTTTRARLALYRKRAEASQWCNDWRKHRYASTYSTEWHSELRPDGTIFTDNKDSLGDYLGDWTEFNGGSRSMRDTTGFYTDNFCCETMRGGVVRLRTARFTLYIPCTYCTGWDGATLYFSDAERVDRGETEAEHDTAKHTACYTAMNRAERKADEAREEDAKFRAEEDIADARAEIHETNKQARALLAEIRGKEFTENVCEALRYRLRQLLNDRKQCFKKIAERQENYWSAVPY